MARVGVYLTPENAAYVAAHAHGKPTRFLNAVLDEHRAAHAAPAPPVETLASALCAALADIAVAIRALEAEAAHQSQQDSANA